jgi:8-oxo-dGTP pyrophosphatase MutT (NUDIX family)
MTGFNMPTTALLPTKGKVAIYVFDPQLEHYMTFIQPRQPAAGRQVPAGTIEAGETPAQTAVRELQEETGRGRGLRLFHFADSVYDMRQYRPEIHLRCWFFGVATADDFPPGQWTHIERRAGEADIEAEFSWTKTSHQHELVAGHADLLPVALHLARTWGLGQG